MPPIAEAIQQSRFESARQRAMINLLYTAGCAKAGTAAALKPHALTWQQFNCMRILRGQCGRPVPMRLIAERMLDPQSNASRLVDKLVDKGYVRRVPCPADRRQVNVSITDLGLSHLEAASEAVRTYVTSIGPSMSDEELMSLSDGLDRLRTTDV